jgi:hypothetical protein
MTSRSPSAAAGPGTTGRRCRSEGRADRRDHGDEPHPRDRRGLRRVEAGALMADINAALIPEGWEMAMFPSTQDIATIGGFVAGGSAGIGSVANGPLREKGNIMQLKALSMEAEPVEHVFDAEEPCASTTPGASTARSPRSRCAPCPRATGSAAWRGSTATATPMRRATRWPPPRRGHRAQALLGRGRAHRRLLSPAGRSCAEGPHLLVTLVPREQLDAFPRAGRGAWRHAPSRHGRGRAAGRQTAPCLRVRLQPHHASGPEIRPLRHLPADRRARPRRCRRGGGGA